MNISSEARRRAFSIWLRTGRRPEYTADQNLEFKFNPWHDPRDGRFTFPGGGGYFGDPGASSGRPGGKNLPVILYVDGPQRPGISTLEQANAWRAEQLAKHGAEPNYRRAIEIRYQQFLQAVTGQPKAPTPPSDTLTQQPVAPMPQSATPTPQPVPPQPAAPTAQAVAPTPEAVTPTPQPTVLKPAPPAKRPSHDALRRDPAGGRFVSGGGSFGGGGATGSWGDDAGDAVWQKPKPAQQQDRDAPNVTSRAGISAAIHPDWRRVIRNGYEFQIDAQGSMRRASGNLTLAGKQVRSRSAQAQAGGPDRRQTDDGGHYIAARFNGPTDAFNHFAQDANFNRGRYRALEDEWARAKRSGHKVSVNIAPTYEGRSLRPSHINVIFYVDGKRNSMKLRNERK